MILLDFSSTAHRMIYASSKELEKDENGKFRTEDFIFFTQHLILQELYSIHNEHKNKFGNLILCLDNPSGGYWRKDVYSRYKSKRKSSKEESPYNWDEIYIYINNLLDAIKLYLPWKVISVKRAEADDIMLVLSRQYNSTEKILIQSPDKDMIQAQKGTDNVFQYSSLTKKWLVPENKHDDMEDWLLEHVCLGDGCDEVPRIIDETEFSENFIHFLKENNIDTYYHEVHNFKMWDDKITKINLINKFDKHKTNKKGEILEKDIYKDIRFGPSSLQKINDGTWELEQRKEILNKQKEELKSQGLKFTHINKEIKSLEIKDEDSEKRFNDWLDSHPLYREHYERNFKLVMEEGIPVDIWNSIIIDYKEASEDYKPVEFEKFLDSNNLSQLKMTMNFESTKTLTIDDFGW